MKDIQEKVLSFLKENQLTPYIVYVDDYTGMRTAYRGEIVGFGYDYLFATSTKLAGTIKIKRDGQTASFFAHSGLQVGNLFGKAHLDFFNSSEDKIYLGAKR